VSIILNILKPHSR